MGKSIKVRKEERQDTEQTEITQPPADIVQRLGRYYTSLTTQKKALELDVTHMLGRPPPPPSTYAT
jgi:hypothetical protein